jgi:hypothetical protein
MRPENLMFAFCMKNLLTVFVWGATFIVFYFFNIVSCLSNMKHSSLDYVNSDFCQFIGKSWRFKTANG